MLYYQRRWCSPVTLVSGNIRLMGIVGLLFTTLSPFHWPPIYKTLNDIVWSFHFTLIFHYYEVLFQQLCYILIVQPIYRTLLLHDVISRDVRKRTVICWILRSAKGRIFRGQKVANTGWSETNFTYTVKFADPKSPWLVQESGAYLLYLLYKPSYRKFCV